MFNGIIYFLLNLSIFTKFKYYSSLTVGKGVMHGVMPAGREQCHSIQLWLNLVKLLKIYFFLNIHFYNLSNKFSLEDTK